MSPENWRRVDKVYEEVLEKAPREREQFLDTACAEDPPEVRAKVEELLRSPEEEESTVFDEVRRRVEAVLSTEPLAEFGGRRSPADLNTPLGPNTAVALDQAPPVVPGCEILTPQIGESDRWPKEGGMGVVWRARDLQFKRLLAVKVMKAKLAGSRWVRLFLREASITAQLAHPSIVPVHAMGRLADGRPYYTMKLIEGKTLADKLQAEPDVKSRRTELLPVFARVCQALAFAHRKGVIHRDATPGNVMVGEHGEVQVMDWGLAKFLAETDAVPADAAQTNGAQGESNERTRSGDVLGKWPYMPPEQANGKIEEVDRRSDVFGLGAILCAILTGKPPYVGPTKADVMRQARDADLAGAYARLEACGAEAELIDLACACLSAKPNNRPEDASVVEKRLTDYLASVQERLRRAELERAAREAQEPAPDCRLDRPREWARVFWYLAAWRVICHVVMVLLLLLGPAPAGYWAWFIGLHVGTWLPVGWLLRSERGLNPIERGLLLNWGATFACDALLFALFCPPLGQARPDDVVRVYAAWPAAHGLWYVAEGRRSWGRFYAVALAYFLAAPLLLFCGLLAPVAYALVVGCAMLFLGESFRRLAAQKADAGASPLSTGDRL
jgi:hypothetical protein